MGRVVEGRVRYAFLCDDIRQEVGNKLSFMGIFGKITVRDLDQPVPTFYLASLWLMSDPSPKTVTVEVMESDGTALREPLKIETPKMEGPKNEFDAYPFAFNVGVGNLKFKKPGKHYFSLRLQDEEVDRVPFVVEKVH